MSANKTSERDEEVLNVESRAISTPEPAPTTTVPPFYTDIVAFLRILVVNIWIIALVFVVGTAITYLYVRSQPDIYQSDASVIIGAQGSEDARVDLPVLDVLRPNIVGNYVTILRSRRVTDPAFEQLRASGKYTERELNEADIQITPISNSTTIEIQIRSTNKELVQDMADSLITSAIANTPPNYGTLYPLEVLDAANDPGDPIGPSVRMTTIFGAAGSLVVGVALAFLLDGFTRYRRNRQSMVDA